METIMKKYAEMTKEELLELKRELEAVAMDSASRNRERE